MFNIDLEIQDGLTQTQVDVFFQSAARWSDVITGDIPTATVNNIQIDDLVIEARGIDIDGPGGTLGRAGPTHIRSVGLLPIKGVMEFDTGDLQQMESDGSLMDVILHEMGHVIGIGTLWEAMSLLSGVGTSNPVFTGAASMREYAELIDADDPTPVPVANMGGPGTRDAHWREQTFGNELMTGFLSGADRPLSRLSVASLEDIGYEVCYEAAEEFSLPSMSFLKELGVMDTPIRYHRCDIARPIPVICD